MNGEVLVLVVESASVAEAVSHRRLSAASPNLCEEVSRGVNAKKAQGPKG